jgi:7-keto-8-aminopelargonate synthetase-like enzyme
MDLHRKLELRMADFLGKEDAIVFNMGYATNSTSISSLIGKVHVKLKSFLHTRIAPDRLLLGWAHH